MRNGGAWLEREVIISSRVSYWSAACQTPMQLGGVAQTDAAQVHVSMSSRCALGARKGSYVLIVL